MAKLEWDEIGERVYEAGVDRVALYVLENSKYKKGVPWNGISAINENPSGGEITPLYADNIRYLNVMSAEEYGLGIEAYNYPEEFSSCDGIAEIATGVTIGQQKRNHFGLTFRTFIGDDQNGINRGYKLHLVYNGIASPSERNHQTIGESTDLVSYSWDVTTTPVHIEGYKPSASLVLESYKFKRAGLYNVFRYIEGLLYGTNNTDSKLPEVNEVVEAFQLEMYLRDSNGELLLDSSGNKIQSRVFD